jgi:hypothetical protein
MKLRKHQKEMMNIVGGIILGSGIKLCSKCHRPKPFNDFHKDKNAADGRYSICADCKNKKSKEWMQSHPGYHKKYYSLNPEKCRERTRRWRERNPEKNRESYQKRHAKERSTLAGKLDNRMRSGIWRSLRDQKGRRKWESLVGYSINDLMRHIGKLFTPGMSWEGVMSGEIHIDHKIPRSVFNYERPEDIDFKKCWALKNLQPMWAFDNKSKQARLEKPFQPSLSIGAL